METILLSLPKEEFQDLIIDCVNACLAKKQPEKPALTYYSRKEVSNMLKISFPTLDRYLDKGLISGNRVGNRILFTQENINTALQVIKKA